MWKYNRLERYRSIKGKSFLEVKEKGKIKRMKDKRIFDLLRVRSWFIEQHSKVVDARLYADWSKDECSSDQSASRYSTRGRKETRNFIKLGESPHEESQIKSSRAFSLVISFNFHFDVTIVRNLTKISCIYRSMEPRKFDSKVLRETSAMILATVKKSTKNLQGINVF